MSRSVPLTPAMRGALRKLLFGPTTLDPEIAAELEAQGLIDRDGDMAWLTHAGRAALRDDG